MQKKETKPIKYIKLQINTTCRKFASIPETMIELRELLTSGLAVDPTTYSLIYRDTEGDLVTLQEDSDLQICYEETLQAGKSTAKIILSKITEETQEEPETAGLIEFTTDSEDENEQWEPLESDGVIPVEWSDPVQEVKQDESKEGQEELGGFKVVNKAEEKQEETETAPQFDQHEFPGLGERDQMLKKLKENKKKARKALKKVEKAAKKVGKQVGKETKKLKRKMKKELKKFMKV